MVPAPAARPRPRKGEDVRLFARRALNYGDENAAKLAQAGEAYGAIADHYGAAAQ